MESHTKKQHSVTFCEHIHTVSADSAEAIAIDEEQSKNYEILNDNIDNTTNMNVTMGGGESGDMQSVSSISTSILDDAEEIKTLKRQISELEGRNRLLDIEIEKVNLCLINEKSKNSKLEKKLQFVKDNQDVFIKLKEAYINMKYNEAAGRKMIEIREKGLQTWDGILCRGCIDAEELRRQLQTVQVTYRDSYIVKPFQLEQILNTIKYLKDLIDRREETWSFNAERDDKMRTHIETLESENATLREVLKTRESNPVEEMATSESVLNSDMTALKKIIIKYEKKIREVEEYSKGQVKITISFNDKEKKMISQLMAKYLMRKRDKSIERSSKLSRNDRSISKEFKPNSSRMDNSHPMSTKVYLESEEI